LNHGGDPATTQRSTASDPSRQSSYKTATHHPSSRKNSLSTTTLAPPHLTMMTSPLPSNHRLPRSASQREYGESPVLLRPSPIDHQHPTRLLPTTSTSRESQCPLAGHNQLTIPPDQRPRLSDLNLPSLRLTKQDRNAGFDDPRSVRGSTHEPLDEHTVKAQSHRFPPFRHNNTFSATKTAAAAALLFNLLAHSLRQHTMIFQGVWIYMHL
jgi:hypothetical protein